MGPFARIISSTAICCLATFTTSTAALVSTTSAAEAKPSQAGGGGNRGGGSRGRSGDRSHGQNGDAHGRWHRNGNGRGAFGPKPGFCAGGIDSASGMDVYDYSVTAVGGARDALQRAAARLDASDIPGPQATTADADALIAQIKAQSWSFRTAAALRVVQRQRDYLEARANLASAQEAQAEARRFASKGIAMSAKAKTTLEEGC